MPSDIVLVEHVERSAESLDELRRRDARESENAVVVTLGSGRPDGRCEAVRVIRHDEPRRGQACGAARRRTNRGPITGSFDARRPESPIGSGFSMLGLRVESDGQGRWTHAPGSPCSLGHPACSSRSAASAPRRGGASAATSGRGVQLQVPFACSAGSETMPPAMSKSATSTSPVDGDLREGHSRGDVLRQAHGPVAQYRTRPVRRTAAAERSAVIVAPASCSDAGDSTRSPSTAVGVSATPTGKPTPKSESSVDIVTSGAAMPSESAGKPSTVDISARSCSSSSVTVAVAPPSSPPRIGTSWP